MQLIKNKNYKSNIKLANLKIDKNNNVFFSNKKNLMNSGIYLLKKKLINKIKPINQSLENELLPILIKKTVTEGSFSSKSFIDIGLKKNLKKSSKLLKGFFKIKAVIFDRDGTLNKNLGYVEKIDRFKWLEGSIETIKFLNYFNIKVVVATNQSGIGRNYYSMKDFKELNKKIQIKLNKNDAHIDKIYCAPYYKYSKFKKYRKGYNMRKPNNGMILKAMKKYNLNKNNCFMIGDKTLDKMAAEYAGIKFFFREKGSLLNQIKKNMKNFLLI